MADHAVPVTSSPRRSVSAVGRKRSLLALKACISASLVCWLASQADLRRVAEALRCVDLLVLAAAVPLQLFGMLLTASRWQGLLGTLGARLPVPMLFRSCLIAGFFRQLLPSTIGGDAFRVYDSWRAGARRETAVVSVAADRLMGLLALALVALAALLFSDTLVDRFTAIRPLVVFGGAVTLLGAWALFVPPSGLPAILRQAPAWLPEPPRRALASLAEAIDAFRGRRGTLARALVLSVLLQLNVVLFYFVIAEALSLSVSLQSFFLIVPLATIIMLAPISINGIGVREGAFVVFLGALGVSRAEALAFAWLEYTCFLAFGVIGGIVYASRK